MEQMRRKDKISQAVIKRLPRYYYCLLEFLDSGITRVSSTAISKRLNITASQVRQDFSNFGEFGQQGYGYDVEYLKDQICKIIGLDKKYKMVIIGAGKIGTSLANYTAFEKQGFVVEAVFDKEPEGKQVRDNIPVLEMSKFQEYISKHQVDIVVVTVPKEQAVKVFELIKALSLKAVWNFAPVYLHDDNMVVENIDMSQSLYMLAYKLNDLNVEVKGE